MYPFSLPANVSWSRESQPFLRLHPLLSRFNTSLSETAACLQFEDEPVPHLLAAVDDLINDLSTDDLSLFHARGSERLREHRVTAGLVIAAWILSIVKWHSGKGCVAVGSLDTGPNGLNLGTRYKSKEVCHVNDQNERRYGDLLQGLG